MVSSSHLFPFEKLATWQKSRRLARNIYIATKAFPKDELYGLTSQLRRSAVSVCSNVAEGASRKSKKDQANFYQIAYSSLMEAACQLILANDFEYLSEDALNGFRGQIEEVSRMLNALWESRKRMVEKSKS